VLAAAQERLEEPRWFIDLEFDVPDVVAVEDDAQGCLALDPGQATSLQLPSCLVSRDIAVPPFGELGRGDVEGGEHPVHLAGAHAALVQSADEGR
jgi:hypothetical protein